MSLQHHCPEQILRTKNHTLISFGEQAGSFTSCNLVQHTVCDEDRGGDSSHKLNAVKLWHRPFVTSPSHRESRREVSPELPRLWIWPFKSEYCLSGAGLCSNSINVSVSVCTGTCVCGGGRPEISAQHLPSLLLASFLTPSCPHGAQKTICKNLVSPFRHVGPQGHTPVIALGTECLYELSHRTTGPVYFLCEGLAKPGAC